MKKNYKICLMAGLLASLFALSNCNKKSDEGSTGDTDDSSTAIDFLQTSSIAVSDGISGINSSQTFMAMNEELTGLSTLANCSNLQLSTCANSVKTLSFDECTRTGANGGLITVFGTATYNFSDSNCTMNTIGQTVTRTLTNHYVKLADGSKILVYTNDDTVGGKTMGAADLKDHEGNTRQGGHVLTLTGTDALSLEIQGVHRRRVRPSGLYGFWHTAYTTTPLTITRSGDEKTVSGTVNIAHNRLATTVSTTFNNTTYESTCCYPTGGSITITAGQTTTSATFSSSCGAVTVDGSAVSMPPCGGE